MKIAITPKSKKSTDLITLVPKNEGKSLSSLDEAMIKDLLQEHGAILFRGFDFNVDILKAFTERFCSSTVLNESSGRRTIDQNTNIQTVNLGTVSFPLHPELSRVPWKPDACFFGCVAPPSKGGETLICDGIEVVKQLPSEFVEDLKSKKLFYKSIASERQLEYWFGTSSPSEEMLLNPPINCPFSLEKCEDEIILTFTAPFFHKTLFQDELAFGNFLLFARDRLKNRFFPTFEKDRIIADNVVNAVREVSDKLKIEIRWQKNDLLMLDNSRFLHGRNKILDPKERLILSSFGYINFDKKRHDKQKNSLWRTEKNGAFFKAMLP